MLKAISKKHSKFFVNLSTADTYQQKMEQKGYKTKMIRLLFGNLVEVYRKRK